MTEKNIAETIAALRTTAAERVMTCDSFLNRRALVAQNWVVVSSRWNGRGIYTQDGNIVVGPFRRQMPTCYSRSDADTLAAQANAEFKDETFAVMSADEWWAIEKADAQAVLESVTALEEMHGLKRQG